MTLTEIGKKYNTDKATYHLYTPEYDKILYHLKEKKIKLLEIGIWYGASLKMWSEYFTNGLIYGIDIVDKTEYETNKIKTLVINQEKEGELLTVDDDFDIIIDDGGHTMLQQQISFKVLFSQKLKTSGIYILEDLHTSLPNYYNSHQSNHFNNTLNLLQDLQKRKLSEKSEYFLTIEEFNALLQMIKSIDIIEISKESITSIITKV